MNGVTSSSEETLPSRKEASLTKKTRNALLRRRGFREFMMTRTIAACQKLLAVPCKCTGRVPVQ